MKYVYYVLHYILKRLNAFIEKLKLWAYRKRYFSFHNPRPDDIIVATYAKSGTTLTQMILYQLTSDGNMNFDHFTSVSPYVEMALQNYVKLDKLPSPRFMKTHWSYENYPSSLEGKIIHVVRNGVDVAVSQHYHYASVFGDANFQATFRNRFIGMQKNWFSHVKGWYENKKGYDILYLRYEEMVADLEGHVRKIAEFCNIPIIEENMPRILERCSFKFMKEHQEKLSPYPIRKISDFVRKGEVNKGLSYFTKQDKEDYMRLYDEHLSPIGFDHYKIE